LPDQHSPPAAGHASPRLSWRRSATRCLGVRDLVASNSQRRSRLLIFLGGANVFAATLFCNRQKHLQRADVSARPRTNIPFAWRRRQSFGPPSGRVRDRLFGRRHSWVLNPFAGLFPIASGAMFPSAGPACRFTSRSPRLIFVAGSVVLKGKLDLKKTNDHELVVAASRLHSRVRSAPHGFLSARARSCLGLCLSQDFGHDIACIPRGHDPAWIISLRKPFPAPIRSWVLRHTSNEMISWPIARCSLRGALPRRSATQALRRSPVHPCRAAASGVGTAAALCRSLQRVQGADASPTRRSCVALWATHPASRRLPV
jgi:hypothetical protein